MLAWIKAHKHLLCVSALVVIFTLVNVVNTDRNYYAPEELVMVWLLQLEVVMLGFMEVTLAEEDLRDDQEQEDRP